MKLTKTQLTWLKNSLKGKDVKPNFWKVFWSVKNAWLIAIPIAAFGIWEFVSDSPVLGCVLISVAWGNIFSSIALSTRAVSLSSAFREVTNWERVRALIQENEAKPIN